MYLECVSPGLKHNNDAATYWNEQIWDLFLILSPGIAVLSSTPRDVSLGTVDDHDHEEDKVKPRKRTPGEWSASARLGTQCESNGKSNLLETGDKSPGHREEHVRDIIRLANDCEPAIHHNPVSSPRFDDTRIFDDRPGHVRKRLTLDQLTTLLLTERVLLAIGRVPHPVHEQVHNSKYQHCGSAPAVLRRIVISQVERAVAVGERDTCHIPEGQDETQLFEVHVPNRLSAIMARRTDADCRADM